MIGYDVRRLIVALSVVFFILSFCFTSVNAICGDQCNINLSFQCDQGVGDGCRK